MIGVLRARVVVQLVEQGLHVVKAAGHHVLVARPLALVLFVGQKLDVALRAGERRADVVGEAGEPAAQGALALLGGDPLALVPVDEAVHGLSQQHEPPRAHSDGDARVAVRVAFGEEPGDGAQLAFRARKLHRQRDRDEREGAHEEADRGAHGYTSRFCSATAPSPMPITMNAAVTSAMCSGSSVPAASRPSASEAVHE